MTPELMTAEEVAETLRMHVKTIRKMAERGELPSTRVGRNIRFLREDINNIIYQHYRKV